MFRRAEFFLLLGMVGALLLGCQPSQADLEDSIRKEMKTNNQVDISTFDMKKQADGGYVGTATAKNGDVWEVSAVKKDNGLEWQAIQGQALVEKMIRDGVQSKTGGKIKSINLTKKAPGAYNGTAELESGEKLKVTTSMQGKQLLWEVEPVKE